MRHIDADKLEFDGKLLKDNENELIGMNGVGFIGKRNGKTIRLLKSLFKQMIENAPTEDVVPRAEVEKARQVGFELGKTDNIYGHSVDKMAKKIEELSIELEQAKQEVAREIFEEIETLLDIYSCSKTYVGSVFEEHYFEGALENKIQELKKKYIGETK